MHPCQQGWSNHFVCLFEYLSVCSHTVTAIQSNLEVFSGPRLLQIHSIQDTHTRFSRLLQIHSIQDTHTRFSRLLQIHSIQDTHTRFSRLLQIHSIQDTHTRFSMERLHQPAKAMKACIWLTNLSFSFQIQVVLMKSGLAS